MKATLAIGILAVGAGGGLGIFQHLATTDNASLGRIVPPAIMAETPPLELAEVQVIEPNAAAPRQSASDDLPGPITLPTPVTPINIQDEYKAVLVNYRSRLQEIIEERALAGVANTVFLPASNQPQAVEYPLGKQFRVDPDTQLHFRSIKGTDVGTEIYDEVFEILEFPELFEMRAEVGRLQGLMRDASSVASGD